ncbi:SUF system Fe-S cluster assembly regulator [Minwuia thermotolerans]|uniref:SUF system Fe-S cluster assembly regulator n=1 Tax=Minwuia thermotolerans TaxID=2056226 RepID=A0A2M9G7H5_9PROT|nr:SUF system Fe-S cluster assembly regulator [Minwuia thermotolerans]PJK31677.1 SUF system Fe-S cluster assembly regulator [Minwuia thermotolerans]
MMRLSKMTDYAVVMMGHMGQSTGRVFAATQIADGTGVPQPTVSKLLKELARGGLLVSIRGAQGGYRLDRTPDEITVAEIVQALEGPIALTACVDGADDSCHVESFCGMRGNWNKVNNAIRTALESVTLADMAVQPMAFPPAEPVREREEERI